MQIDKRQIKEKLILNVKKELEVAQVAAQNTASYKNDESMRAEGKYDTRSIEAGYLAGAQMKRVEDLKLELQMLEEIPVHEFSQDDEASIGALVEIDHKNQIRPYYLSSTAGGTLVDIDGHGILVISVFSPLGQEVLGLKVGDEFQVETPQNTRDYKVVSIC